MNTTSRVVVVTGKSASQYLAKKSKKIATPQQQDGKLSSTDVCLVSVYVEHLFLFSA